MTDADMLKKLKQAILEIEYSLRMDIECGKYNIRDTPHTDRLEGYVEGVQDAYNYLETFIGKDVLAEMSIRSKPKK